MTKLRTLVVASAFGLATLTAASAATFTPQIPTPANPHPAFPVATDGTPLPPMGWARQQPMGWAAQPMDESLADVDLY